MSAKTSFEKNRRNSKYFQSVSLQRLNTDHFASCGYDQSVFEWTIANKRNNLIEIISSVINAHTNRVSLVRNYSCAIVAFNWRIDCASNLLSVDDIENCVENKKNQSNLLDIVNNLRFFIVRIPAKNHKR